jgi:hypothetical protein
MQVEKTGTPPVNTNDGNMFLIISSGKHILPNRCCVIQLRYTPRGYILFLSLHMHFLLFGVVSLLDSFHLFI